MLADVAKRTENATGILISLPRSNAAKVIVTKSSATLGTLRSARRVVFASEYCRKDTENDLIQVL